MADINQTARDFTARTLNGEREAARALARSYAAALRRINVELMVLADKVEAATARGEFIGPAWLFRERRLERLKAQIEGELRAWASAAAGVVLEARALAGESGARDAGELLERYGPGLPVEGRVGDRLATGAVRAATATTRSGPLRALFGSLAPEGAELAGEVLVSGIATGKNPRRTAREVAEALNVNLARALVISRTETLRAYRESSREVYDGAGVERWRWLCARTVRTCAVCWAMDGTEHKVAEPFGTHPNCRCCMVPVLPGDTPAKRGAELFDELPDEARLRVLGPGKLRALEAGHLALPNLVETTRHPLWGLSRRERSLRSILA